MKSNVRQLLLRLATIGFLSGLSACEQNRQMTEIDGFTMGTVYSVKLHAAELGDRKEELAKDIETLLDGVNQQMSTYDTQSVLSVFNRYNGTDWVTLPQDLLTVIQAALEIAELSQGALDITIGPLVNLWGFGPDPDKQVIPDDNQIQAGLERTGFNHLDLDPEHMRLKKNIPDMYIDLSAIAKGFGVDKIAAYLEEQGIENYMVEIGGEIRARGVNPANQTWRIGIEKPKSAERDIQLIIPLKNQAMATSGDYRNFHEIDGVHYSHTIDPRTGKPVTHRLAAVTVVHPSTMMADGFATALLVMGPKHGLQLAMDNDLSALFLVRRDNDFIEIMTPDFKLLLNNE